MVPGASPPRNPREAKLFMECGVFLSTLQEGNVCGGEGGTVSGFSLTTALEFACAANAGVRSET